MQFVYKRINYQCKIIARIKFVIMDESKNANSKTINNFKKYYLKKL